MCVSDLLGVGQLLQSLIYTLLQNSDLLVLLFANTVDLSCSSVKLSKEIVDLLLLRLGELN